MIIIANVPLFKGTQTGWVDCGEPIPTQDGYYFIPYGAGILSVSPDGKYSSISQESATSAQYVQISGNFIVIENSGRIVIPIIPNLV